jgi:hypothetical protein
MQIRAGSSVIEIEALLHRTHNGKLISAVTNVAMIAYTRWDIGFGAKGGRRFCPSIL